MYLPNILRPPPTTTPSRAPIIHSINLTPSSPPFRSSEAFNLIASLPTDSEKRQRLTKVTRYEEKLRDLQDIEKQTRAMDLEKQIPRIWKAGDVYAPHDLSGVEMQKWKKKKPVGRDAFDMLGMNPLHEWKNVSIMGEYMTQMGRIRHRKDTGLRPVNQRKIAKAIRRAVAMGFIPSTHRHPEILEAEIRERNLRRQFQGSGFRVVEN